MGSRGRQFLRDKYAIVGVGETTYTRGSGVTTRKLGSWAVRNAIEDAGLKPSDVDGVLSTALPLAARSAAAAISTDRGSYGRRRPPESALVAG